jgi:phenylacetate-CoA ligase
MWDASARDPVGLERRFYELFERSERWSAERLREHQLAALEPLLRHARAEVPFYRERLAPLFSDRGDILWDNWLAVPILKREDIVAHGSALQANSPMLGHGGLQRVTTTGTSGPPITVMHTRLMQAASRAAVLRTHIWQGLDWTRPMLFWIAESVGHCQWPNGCRFGPWGPLWLAGESSLAQQHALDRSVTAAHLLDYAERNGIAYLSTRAKAAQELALALEGEGRRLELSRVLAFSTAVLADERKDVRAALGCEIVSQYSSKEVSAIACQCPRGEHFHINAAAMLVEVLDDENRPCDIGQLGHVVVTPFYNSVQPLIRYDQGDLAVAGEPCTCGLNLPVLKRIAGRTMNLFRFPDGRRVALAMPDGLRRHIGARYWQFAQIGPMEIEVRYVPHEAAAALNTGPVVDALRLRLHLEVAVRFRSVGTLLRAGEQKFVEYVCELAPGV